MLAELLQPRLCRDSCSWRWKLVELAVGPDVLSRPSVAMTVGLFSAPSTFSVANCNSKADLQGRRKTKCDKNHEYRPMFIWNSRCAHYAHLHLEYHDLERFEIYARIEIIHQSRNYGGVTLCPSGAHRVGTDSAQPPLRGRCRQPARPHVAERQVAHRDEPSEPHLGSRGLRNQNAVAGVHASAESTNFRRSRDVQAVDPRSETAGWFARSRMEGSAHGALGSTDLQH